MAAYLDDLNPAQREAVTHGEGPLLVIAGAGTGKTKTLACRVAALIDRGVPADRILLLTFTRRAAAEMLSRAGALIDAATGGAAGRVWGGTFHAVANRLLRMYGRAVGLANDFTVMDQGDAADMLGLVRADLGLSKDRRFPRKDTLLAIYSRTVNAQDRLEHVLEVHFPWCREDLERIRAIFEAYVNRKREHNVLDYDDLLLYWNALCNVPGAGQAVADRFEHILVDEYQDTNAVQAEIIRQMRRRNRNVMVVGDDAQSIYSFRAATVRNILDFPRHFPGARIVTLEQNYRSTQPILAASNAVMAAAKERYTKELWSTRRSERIPALVTCLDEPQQCRAVCDRVLAHLEEGVPLRRQAVLFRAGHHSDQLEVELARRKIPFHKYGGLKFVEAAHVKDMLALLRILENPYDALSWMRVLRLLRGIGERSARRILEELGVRRDRDAGPRPLPPECADSPLRRAIQRPPRVPAGARAPFRELRRMLADCTGILLSGVDKGGHDEGTGPEPSGEPPPAAGESPTAGGGAGAGFPPEAEPRLEAESHGSPEGRPQREPPLVAQLERIRRFYEPIFAETYENPTIRLRDIDTLQQIAGGYRSRSRFLTDLTLDPPVSTSDLAGAPYLEEDYLTLSTIHSAKGCEWDVVHIIHAADGNIPSDMALGDTEGIEEERRLFYVAMTRAKDMLYIYYPLRYYHRRSPTGDAHSYAQRTRFIRDADRKLYDLQTTHADAGEEFPTHAQTIQDVRLWLSRLWKE